MKKLTTLFAFMLSAMFVSAQDVVFTNNDVVLEDETTVNIDAFVDDEYQEVKAMTDGLDFFNNKLPNQIKLKNQSSSKLPIRATATILSRENEASAGWCIGIGEIGQCVPFLEDYITKEGSLNSGEEAPLELDAYFNYGTPGYVNFKVVVMSGIQTLRTLYVNLNYMKGSGVHSTQNDAELSMNGNNIIYKLAEAGQHTIDVYNVTGSLVKSVEVGQEGTLSLEGLSKGIYIYTAKTNGKQVAVQKCIIK